MTLALSAEALGPMLALLQSGTHCRINVDPLSFSISTFKRTLKTELFDIAYSEREHSAIVSATMRL